MDRSLVYKSGLTSKPSGPFAPASHLNIVCLPEFDQEADAGSHFRRQVTEGPDEDGRLHLDLRSNGGYLKSHRCPGLDEDGKK